MSKVSEAKQKQGYVENATLSCGSCKHYTSETVTRSKWFGNRTEEKNKRCGIGGFVVKKTARCNLLEEKK